MFCREHAFFATDTETKLLNHNPGSGDEDDALKMASDSIVGLVIAFELAVEGSDFQKDIRLGYLLSERFWGQGFASELV